MRTTSGLVAFAASLATTSAAYQGFNYGSTFTSGAAKLQADFLSEFQTAQGLAGTNGAFTSARLYTMIQAGTANTPIQAIPAAIASKTSLLLGLWASAGQANIDNEIAALKAAIQTYGAPFASLIAGISVGSEDLYRNSPTGIINKSGAGAQPDELVSYIAQVRAAIAGTAASAAPVGHVDTWTAYVNGSNNALISACDFLGMDAYPYFQTTQDNTIENSNALFFEAYNNTVAVAQGKPVFTTETGWPSAGPLAGQAVTGVANAETYWSETACELFSSDINTWWYVLNDDQSNGALSFSVTAGGVQPLYDLSCPVKASVSAPVASSSATSTLSSATSAISTSVIPPVPTDSASSVSLKSTATSIFGTPSSSAAAPSSVPAKDSSSAAAAAPSSTLAKDSSSAATAAPSSVPAKDSSSAAAAAPSSVPAKDSSSAAAATPSSVPAKDSSSAAAATPSSVPAKDSSSAAAAAPSSVPGKDSSSVAAAPSSVPAKDSSSAAAATSSAQPSATGGVIITITSTAYETVSACSAVASSPATSASAAPASKDVTVTSAPAAASSSSAAPAKDSTMAAPKDVTTSIPAQDKTSTAAPAVVTSAAASASAPAVVTSAAASASAPAPAASGSACPTTLTPGAYEYPHLIVPVNASSPSTAYGTSYSGTITPTVSSIFNFDVPASDAGKTCTLVFLFPQKKDLQTSDYTYSAAGGIAAAQLKDVATKDTTFANQPEVGKTLTSIPALVPGNSYVLASGACPAGQAVAYELSSTGGLTLSYFEDYNPSPLGLFMTVC